MIKIDIKKMITYSQYLKGGGLVKKFQKPATPMWAGDYDQLSKTGAYLETNGRNVWYQYDPITGKLYSHDTPSVGNRVHYGMSGQYKRGDDWKEVTDEATINKYLGKVGGFKRLNNGQYIRGVTNEGLYSTYGDDNTVYHVTKNGKYLSNLGYQGKDLKWDNDNEVWTRDGYDYINENGKVFWRAKKSPIDTGGQDTPPVPPKRTLSSYDHTVSREEALRRQRLMQQAGIDFGGVDGKFGAKSQAGWNQYLQTYDENGNQRQPAMLEEVTITPEPRYTNAQLYAMKDGSDELRGLSDEDRARRTKYMSAMSDYDTIDRFNRAAETYNEDYNQAETRRLAFNAANAINLGRLTPNSSRINDRRTAAFNNLSAKYNGTLDESSLSRRDLRYMNRMDRRNKRAGLYKDGEEANFYTRGNNLMALKETPVNPSERGNDYEFKYGGAINYLKYI